jgi:trimeric autotransporter adhesin
VDGEAVLEKLVTIPVEKWNYKWEPDTNPPHIGPMAQDFKGAFYPGRDDKSISTLEFDGVELAAIQGLNKKVEVSGQNAEVSIRKLEAENAELRQSMAELNVMVKQLVAQK